MISIPSPRLRSQDDYDLERRVVLELLSLRQPRFQHVRVKSGQSGPLVRSHAGLSVQVEAHDGQLTLTGQVPSVVEKQMLALLVSRVAGVEVLTNLLEVATMQRRKFLPEFAA